VTQGAPALVAFLVCHRGGGFFAVCTQGSKPAYGLDDWNYMPKRQSQKRDPNPELTVAVSLQEASTWVRQAAIALETLEDKQGVATMAAIQKHLVRVHNKHSRVKMS